jgi:hypothetical protein
MPWGQQPADAAAAEASRHSQRRFTPASPSLSSLAPPPPQTNFDARDYTGETIPPLTGKSREEVKTTLKSERIKQVGVRVGEGGCVGGWGRHERASSRWVELGWDHKIRAGQGRGRASVAWLQPPDLPTHRPPRPSPLSLQAPRRRFTSRQRTSRFMGVGSSNRKNQWQARYGRRGEGPPVPVRRLGTTSRRRTSGWPAHEPASAASPLPAHALPADTLPPPRPRPASWCTAR